MFVLPRTYLIEQEKYRLGQTQEVSHPFHLLPNLHNEMSCNAL